MINGITSAVWGLANRLVSEETIVHPEYTRQAWFLRSCVTRFRHGIDRLCFPCVSRRLLLLHVLLPQPVLLLNIRLLQLLPTTGGLPKHYQLITPWQYSDKRALSYNMNRYRVTGRDARWSWYLPQRRTATFAQP
jgi:hypothetical protein